MPSRAAGAGGTPRGSTGGGGKKAAVVTLGEKSGPWPNPGGPLAHKKLTEQPPRRKVGDVSSFFFLCVSSLSALSKGRLFKTGRLRATIEGRGVQRFACWYRVEKNQCCDVCFRLCWDPNRVGDLTSEGCLGLAGGKTACVPSPPQVHWEPHTQDRTGQGCLGPRDHVLLGSERTCTGCINPHAHRGITQGYHTGISKQHQEIG